MRSSSITLAAVALGVLVACDQGGPTSPLPEPTGPSGAILAMQELDVSACAFGQAFSLESNNDWFPITVGSQWFLEGEEDGERIELRITVLGETETVGGVTTRVIEEVEWVDGELLEESRNFVASTEDGTVCYFGEDVNIYEDGGVSHGGAWRADQGDNFPGILMPADPHPGLRFVMEGAPGEAEDEGRVVGAGPTRVPVDVFTDVIRIRESNPLDGDFDFKVYAEDVGIIVDGPLALVSYHVSD
jgi:hypothetical protein